MPRKVSRKDRQSTKKFLCRPKKNLPPNKRKSNKIISTSSKKIKLNTSDSISEDLDKYNRIVDFPLVFSHLSKLVKCINCDGEIHFESCKKEGLGFNIKFVCKNCEARYIPSSKRINSNSYEINTRFTFVMRMLGFGLAGCNKFCGLMDLCSNFIAKGNYNRYVNEISISMKSTASRFLLSAINEEK